MHLKCQSEDPPKYENTNNLPFKVRNKTNISIITTSTQHHTKSQCQRNNRTHISREEIKLSLFAGNCPHKRIYKILEITGFMKVANIQNSTTLPTH